MKIRFHQPTILLASALLASGPLSAEVDFGREIHPILSEHCFHCHGPDDAKREAQLRLDTREGATSVTDDHAAAIIPGKPDTSEFMRRVTSTDADSIMPPPEQHKPLNAGQVALLRKWITEGAPYSKHWSFVAPRKLPLPAGSSNPVDAWVAQGLGSQKLQPSPPAKPEFLIRRLHIDLVGTLPTPEEIDSFSKHHQQDSKAAVIALTERLLSSKAFGEKWARHWLDVARYSDSNGFEKDLPREQWVYRDWVIDAINRDMPFDKFLIEQVAGDMLAERGQQQIIASGFLRNGMVNEEGAIIPEQFRIEGMFDRVDVIGKATLGLSLQCAQCHTHKFDPITHDEYFGIFAFLNDTHEAQSAVHQENQLEKIANLRREIHGLEEQIRKDMPDWSSRMAEWEKSQRASAIPWTVLDTETQILDGGLNHPVESPDHSIQILGHRTNFGLLLFEAEPSLTGITGLRIEALTDLDLPFGGPGRSPRGTFAISELAVEIKPPGSDAWKPVPLANASSDFAAADRAFTEVFTPTADRDKEGKRRLGPVKFLADGDELTAWYPDRGPELRHTESSAALQFPEKLDAPKGTKMRIRMVQVHGGGKDGLETTQIGRLRFALSTAERPFVPALDHAAMMAMEVPPDARSEKQHAALFRAWRKQEPALESINQQIAELEKQFPEAETSVLHLEARRDTRPTHLLDRGAWDAPRQIILPHTPAALHPFKAETRTRLDFARWLVSNDSPLTARVQVNRVWQVLFGAGFVDSPEDFGVRCQQPAQLNLLDWLAVDFMEHEWSLKSLLRTIIDSKTYQQSSHITAEMLEQDPANVWLARAGRFRMDAEGLRDALLCASGLLNHRPGGPGVFPPVPQSVIDNNFVKPEYWLPAEGAERYRRSIYQFRKRSMPDPVFGAFDAPNGDFSCARRMRSNSPLAALTTLNEPVFVEAAHALASRLLTEAGTSGSARIQHAYRLCVGRLPSDRETETILSFIQQRRDDAATPEHEKETWFLVARVIMNLDESLNRN